MKQKIFLSIILIITLYFFTGCPLLVYMVTIEQRIDSFIGSLNNTDRTNAYLNFHPTATSNYDEIKSTDFWDTNFPWGSSLGYSISGLSDTDSSDTTKTKTVTGVFEEWSEPDKDIEFTLKADDYNNWYIQALSLDGDMIIE